VKNGLKAPFHCHLMLFQKKWWAPYCSFHSFKRKSCMARVTKRCAYAARPKYASNLIVVSV